MQKIKRSFAARLRNALIGVLTLSMLLLAGIYIGGTQFFSDSAALRAEILPDGTVPVGQNVPRSQSLHEKGLLPIAFGGIRYGGSSGGIYGGEAPAKALAEFAADPIHACLGAPSVLEASSAAEFATAMGSNYIFFDLLTPLPYQILYALTGEYSAPATSADAILADRLLLSFPEKDRAVLYLSDGKVFYRAEQSFLFKAAELQTLANDSRLSAFSLAENGVPKCEESPHAGSLTLSANCIAEESQYEALYTLFGFRANAVREEDVRTVVDPHGTLRLTGTRLVFTASKDGGIAVSDLLDTAKDELDIDLYDILDSSVSLVEKLREILPESCGGSLAPYLAGFSREEDTYTVTFGLHADSIPLSGTSYPYFATMTIRGGRFRTVEIRFLTAQRSSYTGTQFSSAWHYAHVEKAVRPDTLRLYYYLTSLSAKDLDAAWFYTAESEVAE